MSAAAALVPTTVERERSLLEASVEAMHALMPSHFVAAIALGLANSVFVGLTYGAPLRAGTIVDLLILFGAMAATVAAARAGSRLGAWGLLAVSYALLVSGAMNHPPFQRSLLVDQAMSHALALAVAIADRRVATGRAGRMVYVIAGLVGVAAGGLSVVALLHFGPDLAWDAGSWPESRLPWFTELYAAYTAFHWLLFGGAGVLFYGERRLSDAALERLRVAELNRIAHERQIVESKLQLMQARIEPRFLFNTLMRVKRLYRREPKLAESMLDELGAFLRAAMPRMRDSSSTVRQETVLVQAYLGIVRVRRRNGIDYAVEVAPHAAEGRLPSMMLLPLVDHAVAHAMRASAGNLRLRLCASVADGRLRLAISTSAISVPERGGAAIAAIRERLDALYRGDASLALGPSATGGMQAVLDIPFQRDADEEKSRAR